MLQPHHLPLHNGERYWIALSGHRLRPLPLESLGFKRAGDLCLAEAPRTWRVQWNEIERMLEAHDVQDGIEAAVIPSNVPLDIDEIIPQLVSYLEMQSVVRSLWLGDALIEHRVHNFFQPIVGTDRTVFGYEAFVRVHQPDHSLVGGYAIMAASKILKIEFRLDRYLQQRAICAFGEGHYEGKLFINFFAGFIQRPEVYLDGIAQELERCGVAARNIVLDLAQPEGQCPIDHLKAIADYCRRQGYSIALDDVYSIDASRPLIEMIEPHFVKLDYKITKNALSPVGSEKIAALAELAHRYGAKVIGEGVEDEAVAVALKEAGADLLQGYHIGPPLPVEQAPGNESVRAASA